MSTVIKKENITVIVGTYNDKQGNEKKRYRTIGELITMQGDDGSQYQFGEIWGPHGVTNINIYQQDDKTQQAPAPQQQQQYNNQPQQSPEPHQGQSYRG